MGLGDKSVLKEYKKQAQAATKNALALNTRLTAALQVVAPITVEYNAARKRYQDLLTAFGPDKFSQIAEKKLAPTGGDMDEIKKILAAGDAVMAIGDKWGAPDSVVKDLRRQLDAACRSEKAAYDKIAKYLADKEAVKTLGSDAYKKWKKELRTELFP